MPPYIRAVYPGHPVTIALAIVETYTSYEDATTVDPGKEFSRALSNTEIPGAGGNVYNALHMLKNLEKISWEEAIRLADQTWASCDDQKNRYPERWKAGQEQADALKDRLRVALQAWGMVYMHVASK